MRDGADDGRPGERVPRVRRPLLPYTDHPLTRWAASSHANWRRLSEYTAAAHEEWRYRWDHGPAEEHGCWTVVRSLDAVRDLSWPSTAATDPPRLTGERTGDGYVDAYRSYYANDKRYLFAWKHREAPPWLDEYAVDPGAE